jgi:hypothetical protein
MVTITNGHSTKQVPEGFSWTTFFFGFFPALFRGDVKWAAIILAAALCTFGIAPTIIAFFYNARYLEEKLDNGWKLVDRYGNAVHPK